MRTDNPEESHRRLLAALEEVRYRLGAAEDAARPGVERGGCPLLEQLGRCLGLSSFEQALLLACAGVELDPKLAAACATAQGSGRAYMTLGLALARLPEPHWSAVAPTGALRFWRLVELEEGGELLSARLRIDERILHALMGLDHLDARLEPYLAPMVGEAWLPPSLDSLAEQMARLVSDGTFAPVIHLVEGEWEDALAVAVAACRSTGHGLHRANAHDLPISPAERLAFIRLWSREARWSRRGLLVASPDGELPPERARALEELLSMLDGPVFWHGAPLLSTGRRPLVRLAIPRLSTPEQRLLWQRFMAGPGLPPEKEVEAVTENFQLGFTRLKQAAHLARQAVSGDSAAPGEILWNACREAARPRLGALAQTLSPKASWDDLVLPPREREVLKNIVRHVRHRHHVHGRWGFDRVSTRGLGISALFCGVSGTGKTLAAEVLARELRLDLFRVDLSAVVSKYIGETEKNLRAVFDAAEGGSAILLFDEADALFGKRSEVRDSHDRHANIEVGYLLQRMESYEGLAILTTNMKSSLDDAFLRRLRFIVTFPFPSFEQRVQLWRKTFPREVHLEGVDMNRLARLNVTGGHIRNIALNAAFLAADEGGALGMRHLLEAARAEYAKLDRPLTASETEGWV